LRALIVETGHARGALAAARALREAGWTVGVGTPDGRGLASASRASSKTHRIPGPAPGFSTFAAAVGSVVDAEGYEVVFGAGDAEVIALSACRDRIGAMIPYADHERVMRAVDKLKLAEAAAAAGLLVPQTREATESELERSRAPLIVKAAVHAPLSSETGPGRLEAVLVEDRAGTARQVAALRQAGAVPMLQELVAGRLMACSLVTDRGGRIVAATAQLADGCWPPRTGTSARARTIAADDALFAGIRRLCEDIGWFGLAQLQFVLSEDDRAWLIDFNGRFYGSLALAVAAGVNLPAIWAALATGRPPPEAASPRLGLTYQWLEGDLRRAVSERRGGLFRDLLHTVGQSRGAVHAIWQPGDARPALRQLGRLPARAAGRARA